MTKIGQKIGKKRNATLHYPTLNIIIPFNYIKVSVLKIRQRQRDPELMAQLLVLLLLLGRLFCPLCQIVSQCLCGWASSRELLGALVCAALVPEEHRETALVRAASGWSALTRICRWKNSHLIKRASSTPPQRIQTSYQPRRTIKQIRVCYL